MNISYQAKLNNDLHNVRDYAATIRVSLQADNLQTPVLTLSPLAGGLLHLEAKMKMYEVEISENNKGEIELRQPKMCEDDAIILLHKGQIPSLIAEIRKIIKNGGK